MIALGRLLLATLSLVAMWLDPSHTPSAAPILFALLSAYVVLAAIIAAATWRNWWLDAQIAGPAHAVDILLFTMLVLLTEGYTSPFFTFFVFLLLSAAIRWGWRATALTAVLLTLLQLMVGLLGLPPNPDSDLQRFVIRTGHVVILSLILIWFGANQWRARFLERRDSLPTPVALGDSPVETSLRGTVASLRATGGAFMCRERDHGDFSGLAVSGDLLTEVSVNSSALAAAIETTPFLYEIGSDRALRRDAERNLVDFAPSALLSDDATAQMALREGLAVPIRTGEVEGMLFLEGVRSLSTDHIDLGEQIAFDVAAHIQSHALLRAAEEAAEARSRLSLARDLHDSVVQFLAGAAFRLEAMKRAEASGRNLAPELNELKKLMLDEQRELRAFITALRSGSQVALVDLTRSLKALADRLSKQWDVRCEFSARAADMMVPTRLQLDAHQVMREAVANAVRHAGAKSIKVALSAPAGADELRMEVINDGAAYPSGADGADMPTSLRERAEQAGGAIDIARGMGVTKVSIVLPVGGARE